MSRRSFLPCLSNSVAILIVLIISGNAYATCNGWRGGSIQAGRLCKGTPLPVATEVCSAAAEAEAAARGENTDYDLWRFSVFELGSITQATFRCTVFVPDKFGPGEHQSVRNLSGAATFFMCPSGTNVIPEDGNCYKTCDKGLDSDGECPEEEKNECSKGEGQNPINFLTGNKLFTEVDYESYGINSLKFVRYYNSQNNLVKSTEQGWVNPQHDSDYYRSKPGFSVQPISLSAAREQISAFYAIEPVTFDVAGGTVETFAIKPRVEPLGAIDQVWRHNHQKFMFRKHDNLSKVTLHRPDGSELVFKQGAGGGAFYYPKRAELQVSEFVQETAQYFIYVNKNLDLEFYTREGLYVKFQNKRGYTQTMAYNEEGLLESVTDSLGRHLNFTYDDQGRMVTMTSPEGDEYRYDYIGNTRNFSRVYYPDGDTNPLNNAYRRYVYEDARFPNAITGIFENTTRYGTYAYGGDGKAIYSGLANGAQSYSVDFSVEGQTTVTNSLGKNTVYHYDTSNNLVQIDGEPSANCLGDQRTFTYDSNNFKTQEIDKNGNITTYIRDDQGREISRTEASGTPLARTITTEWHPILNVKTKVTEPERITQFSYNSSGLLLNQTVTPNPAQ